MKQTLSRIKISIAQFDFLQLTLELMMNNKDEVKKQIIVNLAPSHTQMERHIESFCKHFRHLWNTFVDVALSNLLALFRHALRRLLHCLRHVAHYFFTLLRIIRVFECLLNFILYLGNVFLEWVRTFQSFGFNRLLKNEKQRILTILFLFFHLFDA